MGSYIPSTREERLSMLESIGMHSFDELYADIPEDLRLKDGLSLPSGLSELEVARKIEEISEKNTRFPHIFRGAGSYHHYIPAIVKQVTSKEEFVTAYTPYQAEISQGLLQSIFEYQTMICELTGMDVSNASVYDGATAAAEAAEWAEAYKEGKKMTTSCCPAFVNMIKQHFPQLLAGHLEHIHPVIIGEALDQVAVGNDGAKLFGPDAAGADEHHIHPKAAGKDIGKQVAKFCLLRVIAQAGTGTDQIGRFDIIVDTDNNCIDSYTWRTVPICAETCPRNHAMEEVLHHFISRVDDDQVHPPGRVQLAR